MIVIIMLEFNFSLKNEITPYLQMRSVTENISSLNLDMLYYHCSLKHSIRGLIYL